MAEQNAQTLINEDQKATQERFFNTIRAETKEACNNGEGLKKTIKTSGQLFDYLKIDKAA